MKSGAKWYSAPKPMLLGLALRGGRSGEAHAAQRRTRVRCCQRSASWPGSIYLVSATGNELGGHWLQTILGAKFRVHFLKDVYYGSHIDSTLVALRPGLVLCNPERV